MENLPPINEKIIGDIPENVKDNILRCREDNFFYGKIEKAKTDLNERQKTPDDIKIISIVNNLTNELCAKYGCPVFDVPPEKIFITEQLDGRHGEAYGSLDRGIKIEDSNDKIVLASHLAHGIIHLKSKNIYRAHRISKNNIAISQHSVGLAAETVKRRIFANLNEAVTEELDKKITLQMVKDDFFAPETRKTEKTIIENPNATINDGKPLFNEDTYFAREETGGKNFLQLAIERIKREKNTQIITERFTYPRERQILNIMIDKIFANKDNLEREDREKFNLQTREDVFDIFAGSMLNGDLRQVVGLIDHTFEIGTTQEFLSYENKTDRQGKSFNDIEGQLKFVKELGDKNETE